MEIIFKKSFIKQYDKLPKNLGIKVDETIDIFAQNPHHPILKNHQLKGNMHGQRSISAGNDLRIIFEVEGNYIKVLFLAVGTHNQVY